MAILFVMHVETGTRREMPMEKTDASKPSKGGAPRVACDYHLSNERHMTFSLEFSGCWGIERRGDPARPLKQSVVRSAKRVKEEVRFGCAGSERVRLKARFSAMPAREQAHSPQALSYRLQSVLYWPHTALKP